MVKITIGTTKLQNKKAKMLTHYRKEMKTRNVLFFLLKKNKTPKLMEQIKL